MNLFEEHSTHYDVLELTPDATPQEIRSAYLRLKAAYNKENIAHYTLFSREETDAMVGRIENAYLILSNPEKRRAYDQAQGHTHSDPEPMMPSAFAPTDFAASGYGLNSNIQSPAPVAPAPAAPIPSLSASDIDSVIAAETEWSGAFLKKVREAKKISLEDLSDYTRISRIYLNAIEQEDFQKLPAVVYVRGFLQQIAKRLKLPAEVMSLHYLERYKAGRIEKP